MGKVTGYTELVTPADGDWLYVVDVDDTTHSAEGTSKKLKVSSLPFPSLTQFNTHTGDTSNPHSVTAAQVGAPTTTDLTNHTGNTSNPHSVTAAQVGALADAPGTVSLSNLGFDPATQSELDSHANSTSNPHGVTAAQAGAIADSLLTTKGDILVRNGSGNIVRLPVGNDDQALTADSSVAEGVAWKDSGGGGASYDDRLIDSSLEGYWKLDETSGTTAFDSSGKGRHATYKRTSNITYAALNPVIAGVDGGAVFFNSASDANAPFVEIGNYPAMDFEFTSDEATFIIWFWLELNGPSTGALLTKTTNVDGDRQFYMYINSGTLYAFVGKSFEHPYRAPDFRDSDLNDGEWHCAGLTVGNKQYPPGGSNRYRIWLDGVPAADIDGPNLVQSAEPWRIGARGDDNQEIDFPFNGGLSRVRIYSRELMPNEMKALARGSSIG